jgi:virulence factor Mce-like protein
MSHFSAGLLALAVIAIAVWFGFTKAIPFKDHFEVKGVFKTANDIKPGSLVRVAGVNVGKVTAVDHAGDGRQGAVVTMRIDKRGLPIHRDARLKIRPRIFLEGNFFVDVEPGTPSSPALGDGDVVPVNQTATPVQLDQILASLQSDTRDDLQSLLKEYSTALDGKGGEGFKNSIPYWKPAYRDGALVSDAMLGQAEHDLSEYEREAAIVAEALDRNPAALKGLISDLNATARGFAAENANLRAAVAELPRTLRAAHPALAALNDSFPSLRALARELRPGVRSSEPAIDASMPLVRQMRGLVGENELKGLVRDLGAATPSLTTLSERTVPLYREVRRASSCQNDVILPWTRDKVVDQALPTDQKVYEESVKPLTGLAGESRSGDANGQWFRVLTSGGTNLVTLRPGVFATTDLPFLGTNPPKPKERPPLVADVPCETQQAPDLRSQPGPPPEQRQIDTTSPAYQARYAKDKAAAIEWLRGQLKYQGLADEITVGTAEVTPAQIAAQLQRTRADQARRARLMGGTGG